MRIAIVGAGALGSVYGALLAGDHDVWLVHRRQDYVEHVRRQGVRLEDAARGRTTTARVAATTRAEDIGRADAIIVLVKSLHTRDAAEAARHVVGPETIVVSLQNGLGNRETLAAALGEDTVVPGLTYNGAATVGHGHVRWTVAGETFVGEATGNRREQLRRLVTALEQVGMPTKVTAEVTSMIWGKLVLNAAINATTALTGVRGGELAARPGERWVGLVAKECAAVAAGCGVRLPYPDPAARARAHCAALGDAKSSMQQDVEARRPSEVAAINGAIVDAGRAVGVPTPYNQALLSLMQILERRAAI